MAERKLVPLEYYRETPKWAVIVGISEYKHQGWKLDYAHRDAEELCKLLQTENGGKFTQDKIRLLTNKDATKRNIELALNSFLSPQKDDLVLLYFACHGARDPKRPNNKQLYLLTHDTEPDKISATGLRMREIQDCLQALIAKKVIILADTCHSGGISVNPALDYKYRDIEDPTGISLKDNSAQVTRYLQLLNESTGGLGIMTSAEATQKSQEGKDWGGGHGVFTHFLLEGMRGEADEDNDGIVTAGDLFEYVRKQVKLATNDRQIPFIDANNFDRSLPVAITDIKEEAIKVKMNLNQQKKEKAPVAEDNISEKVADVETIFRQAVVESIDDNNKINPIKDFKLNKLAKELGITDKAEPLKNDEISRIIKSQKTALEKAELARNNKIEQLKLVKEEYITVLKNLIEQEYYPFSKEIEIELKGIQLELGLSDEHVKEISAPILELAKQNHEFEQKLGSKIKPFSFEVITVDRSGQEISKTSKTADYFSQDLGDGVELEMVAIPGGEFLMGTEDAEIKRLIEKYSHLDLEKLFNREKPRHRVKVPPFFIGKYPVTQAQYQVIMENNPANFSDNLKNPVEQVSWDDAKEFCKKLSKKTGIDYRLPSEAEWEYAARAGTNTPFYFGETITTNLANYRGTDLKSGDETYPGIYADEPLGEYREATTPVGNFPPNSFGLYDIHGNVLEWCEDDLHDNYDEASSDGSAWLLNESIAKVIRGGSWYRNPDVCRSAYRYWDLRVNRNNDIGFRVVCVAPRTP